MPIGVPLDAAEFIHLLNQTTHKTDTNARKEQLKKAIDSYVGDLLPGLYSGP